MTSANESNLTLLNFWLFMDLGNSIKNIRKQRNITQVDFAKRCGITQTYLSLIENNQKEPNLSTLKAIGRGLDIPLPILFFLAMDEKDVPPKKRDAFKLISPSVKSFVNEFFAV
jgi:transcriptional regulator with XRE-family HTH domain